VRFGDGVSGSNGHELVTSDPARKTLRSHIGTSGMELREFPFHFTESKGAFTLGLSW